jgi:hypothetical protein
VTRLLLLALAVLAAGATGCGGGGGSAASERPRLSPDAFVEQGNGVCIRADRRIFRIGSLGPTPGPWKETANAAARSIREMRELRPPAARQKQFDALLAAGEKVRRAVSDVHEALVRQKYDAAREAQVRAVRADADVKRIAHNLGLTFCEQLLTNWPA